MEKVSVILYDYANLLRRFKTFFPLERKKLKHSTEPPPIALRICCATLEESSYSSSSTFEEEYTSEAESILPVALLSEEEHYEEDDYEWEALYEEAPVADYNEEEEEEETYDSQPPSHAASTDADFVSVLHYVSAIQTHFQDKPELYHKFLSLITPNPGHPPAKEVRGHAILFPNHGHLPHSTREQTSDLWM